MNDGCCPSLAMAITYNIALIPSGASMDSSNIYVGRNEVASFLKQGYSLSASGSTEEEWFSASTWEAHEMGMNFSSPSHSVVMCSRGTMPCPAELGWCLLSGPAEVNAHQAWKSCPESWNA